MRLTAVDAIAQKSKIVESAKSVFLKYGYQATKMDDIASHADLSRSPLYYHYRNKKVLFTVVFDKCCTEMEELDEAVYSSHNSIFEKVRRCIRFSVLESTYGVEILRRDVFSFPDEFSECVARYELMRERLRRYKISAVKRAICDRELSTNSNAETIVEMIFVFTRGLIGEMYMKDNAKVWNERHLEELITDFVDMLAAQYGVQDTPGEPAPFPSV